ncbi:hypothetical protein ACSBR2_040320 [Camellia fascicularis]
MNLFPTYCLNRSKTFLSAQRAYKIAHVRQCFDGGANEFWEVLCKYAVECGFQFKHLKNDFVRITVVCKFVASTDCTWLVHEKMLPSSGVLCIKRFDSVHTCGTAVQTHRNPRTGSDLVSTVVADPVRDQPLTCPTDVVFDLRNEYGLEISYRMAWLGVEKTRSEVYRDHAMSFDQLSACINGFNHCRPLLFLDGTFLKGRFKGFFFMAFTIVDSENAANWEWFLQNLKEMNLRDRMKYVNASHRIGLMRKLRECAYAPTVNCFNEKMDVLKKCNWAVIEGFMKNLHPKHWSNAYFRGQLYGEMCSNAAESFNIWVSDARYLPITRLFDKGSNNGVDGGT